MIGWAAINLYYYHSSYVTTENLVFLASLLVVIIMNIWLLSSSILPLVKIDSTGITAYSIFWKRTIVWNELNTVKLVKVKNRYARYETFIKFEDTKTPEKKRIAALNKGYAVNTFIVVADRAWRSRQNGLVRRGLYNHGIIAGQHAIAFEYNTQAWELINNRRL